MRRTEHSTVNGVPGSRCSQIGQAGTEIKAVPRFSVGPYVEIGSACGVCIYPDRPADPGQSGQTGNGLRSAFCFCCQNITLSPGTVSGSTVARTVGSDRPKIRVPDPERIHVPAGSPTSAADRWSVGLHWPFAVHVPQQERLFDLGDFYGHVLGRVG